MTIQNSSTLKGYFNTGDIPTESQFADLIDSTDNAVIPASSMSMTNKTINDATNYVDADALHEKVFLNLGGASTIGMPVQVESWNVGNSAIQITKCSKSNATKCLGLMETAGADGSVGSVRTSGTLTGVDTSAWSEGDTLYVNTAGALTNTPTATVGEYVKRVGTVARQHATLGVIEVHTDTPSVVSAAITGGAIDWANPVAVTGATTLTAGKHHVMTGTTADYTVTLPTAASSSGKLISVEMSAALTKLVTIDGDGTETIDGSATRIMWAKETAVLLSNGTTWTKVGGKSIPMSFDVFNSASQTGLTLGVYNKANLAGVNSDPNSMLSANDVYFKRPGKWIYAATGGHSCAGGATPITRMILKVYVDGANVGAMADLFPNSLVGTGTGMSSGSPVVATFNTGQYLSLYLYLTATGGGTAEIQGAASGSLTTLKGTEIITW